MTASEIWADFGPFLVGMAGVIVSLIGALLTHRATMKRLEGEAESAVAGAAEAIVASAKHQVDMMDSSIKRLEKRIEEYERIRKLMLALLKDLLDGVECLCNQLEEAGISPQYRPPQIHEEIDNLL